MWADRWGCFGEVKGGNVRLDHELFIVTSTYTIPQLYGPKDSDQPEEKEQK
jgi:hypothetical protein